MRGAAAASRSGCRAPPRARRGRARSGSCGRARPRRSASARRSAGRAGRVRSTRWPCTSITERSVCRNASRAPGPLERRERAGDRLQVDAGAGAALAQARAGAVERRRARGRRRQRDQRGRARQRGAAQQRADLVAEPAAGDQHEPLDRCGNCQKNCIATPPPSEWPTIVARSIPIADEQVADRPPRGRRASSRRAASPSRRGRSGRARSPCSARRARSATAPSAATS